MDRFWQELQDKGPLTEPIADDPKNSWVTFMWRGNSKTWRVHLRGFENPTGSRDTQFALLPGTDLWYRTERIPNNTQFAYIFRINCDEAGPEAYAGQARDAPLIVSHLDPLNPREATVGPSPLASGNASRTARALAANDWRVFLPAHLPKKRSKAPFSKSAVSSRFILPRPTIRRTRRCACWCSSMAVRISTMISFPATQYSII